MERAERLDGAVHRKVSTVKVMTGSEVFLQDSEVFAYGCSWKGQSSWLK